MSGQRTANDDWELFDSSEMISRDHPGRYCIHSTGTEEGRPGLRGRTRSLRSVCFWAQNPARARVYLSTVMLGCVGCGFLGKACPCQRYSRNATGFVRVLQCSVPQHQRYRCAYECRSNAVRPYSRYMGPANEWRHGWGGGARRAEGNPPAFLLELPFPTTTTVRAGARGQVPLPAQSMSILAHANPCPCPCMHAPGLPVQAVVQAGVLRFVRSLL